MSGFARSFGGGHSTRRLDVLNLMSGVVRDSLAQSCVAMVLFSLNLGRLAGYVQFYLDLFPELMGIFEGEPCTNVQDFPRTTRLERTMAGDTHQCSMRVALAQARARRPRTPLTREP